MKKYFQIYNDFKKHADRTLRNRILYFFIMYFIILLIIILDLADETISPYLALVGLMIGGLVAYLTRRMFITHWKNENKKVAIRLDFSAILSIGLYLFFMATRNWVFSQWVIKKNLDAFVFCSIAGAMLARIFMILSAFKQIVKEKNLKQA
jgi:hypothetical protein